MKPLWVPAVPFLVSLACSAATVGGRVGWQDSGYYLCAVHERAVLYPTGFVLYLALCKGWTLALGFVDFTVAVHLFSSFCAAAAAGAIALGARDLLGAQSKLFRTGEPDPGPLRDWAAAAAGVLAATGYTFWGTALMAKGYALYYLILSLLLWRMIRAHESGKGRDFTIVAVLIGLAWQAHPSAVNTGPALLAFVALHRKRLGWKGLAGRTALAAACALGPLLFLPYFRDGKSVVSFGDPRTGSDLMEYLLGKRFTTRPGMFGWDAGRIHSVFLFLWEEMLGIGLLVVGAGVALLVRDGRRLLAGLLLWILPILLVTVLFKLEGQHDCWFVAAWIPLWMVGAVGIVRLAKLAGPRAKAAAAGLALAGAVWAITVNGPLLNQRGYALAEIMGGLYLDPVERGALVIVRSDDTASVTLYLQHVRRHRSDVVLARASHLGEAWYSEALAAAHPGLATPDYEGIRRRFPRHAQVATGSAAFANANVSPDRSVYFEFPPPPELIHPDYVLVPAGPMFRLAPRGDEKIDRRFWATPIEVEQVVSLDRRRRGQLVALIPGGIQVSPEAYERRLFRELLRARKNLADWLGRSSSPDAIRRCAELYESLLKLDPVLADDEGVILPLGIAYLRLERLDLAEPWLKRAMTLNLSLPLRQLAMAGMFDLCLKAGRTEESLAWKARVLASPNLSAELREKLESSR